MPRVDVFTDRGKLVASFNLFGWNIPTVDTPGMILEAQWVKTCEISRAIEEAVRKESNG